MTALDLAPSPRPAVFARALSRALDDDSVLARLTVVLALSLFPTLAAMLVDPREILGVNAWVKPVKFQIALLVYTGTIAFFARFLPDGMTARRWYRVYVSAVAFCILAELLWIGGASALGTTSHFNVYSPLWSALYGLMGLFAVILTSASLVHGIAILRNRGTRLPPALRLGIGLGLVLTFVLTVPVAGYLASGTGHFVGTPSAGAESLWLMGWSREVGDLRVAHFFATHPMHAVPLAAMAASALLPGRAATGATLAAAVLYTGFVGLTFWQALAGQPFLPWLG